MLESGQQEPRIKKKIKRESLGGKKEIEDGS